MRIVMKARESDVMKACILDPPLAFATPLPLASRSKPLSSSQTASQPDKPITRTTKPVRRERRCTILSKSPSEPPDVLPRDAVPYFAYFSNMNPNKIGPLSQFSARRCNIYRSQKACLPSHDLVFDVPGAPPEPAFANIVHKSSSSVHGILHWLSRRDFDRIARSEGFLPVTILTFSRIKEVDVVTSNDDSTSETITAKTIVFNYPVPSFIRGRMRPSRRYVQVAVDGAEYWGINKDYVKKLKSIPTARGPLGGFGLLVEPRPHLLDRPNSYEQFGQASSEMYSPWNPIRSKVAVETVEKSGHNPRETKLQLLRLSNTTKKSASPRKPLYYIPGIDGTGKGILSQVDGLDQEGIYDVSTFIYPFANRQSLTQLAEELITIINDDAGEKPVTLVGESMGGVVSLLLAMENTRRRRENSSLSRLNIDTLMLINPATSFRRSNPRALWEFLLSLGFSEEMYARLLPPVLLPFIIDFDAMRNRFGPDNFPRLRKMLSSLSELSHLLPRDALSWRIKLLSEFSVGRDELEPLGSEFGPSRVALISSVNDNLIPSLSESYRLQRYIPNLYSMVLPYGGHVPSFDSRFSLAAFLRAFNDAQDKPRNDNTLTVPSPSVLKRRAAFKQRLARNLDDNVSEQKTREEVGKLRSFLHSYTKGTAPVFIGEENIPEYNPNRPVLFVCNHTLLGWLDAMYPVERILKRHNVLIRSLAHPMLFKQAREGQFSFPNTPRVLPADLDDFGIVPVGPRQLLEQFARGRWTLLFPGGAREALKENEAQKYSLKWPAEPEFVRACALFGAQIIPVSTVGTEDMVRILASPKQVQRVLDAGSRLVGRPIDWNAVALEILPWRERGVPDSEFGLIPPLMLPSGADRIYFRFGKPIDIDEACLYDQSLERQFYDKVRSSVSEGIEILLRRRELDDYRATDRRREFQERHGENVEPPCGTAWLWSQNGSFLDEDKQPPL